MSYTIIPSHDDQSCDTEKSRSIDEQPQPFSQTTPARSRWLLLALTCTVGGLQVVWSVILSNGAPRLVALGLSESLTAIVWISGPLCGTIVQPYLGLRSDQSCGRWGRRRPFIVAGAIGTILSILALGWLEDIVRGMTAFALGNASDPQVASTTIVLAVLCIYALNIAIQSLQMGIRALVVDTCPKHQQSQASGWSAAMTGLGNLVGYAVGFAKITDLTPSLTQFQGMCIAATVAVAVSVLVTCVFVTERTPSHVTYDYGKLRSSFQKLRGTYRTMPVKIRRVCHIQAWAWMGLFPFLFYSTTFIADIYGRKSRITLLKTLLSSKLTIEEEATRLGTFACFLFAIVSLLTNTALPLIMHSPLISRKANPGNDAQSTQGPLVGRTWTIAHVLFAIIMLATNFVSTPFAGTALIAAAGLPWAITLFAPYAIIGEQIAKNYHSVDDDESDLGGQAATVLSLHNIAISAPQIVAALVCSGVFALAQVLNVTSGTQWAFGLGAFATLRAAWLSTEGLDD